MLLSNLMYLYWNKCVTCVVFMTIIKVQHVHFASVKHIKCPRGDPLAVLSNHDLNAQIPPVIL